ncbi:MAG: hypothetical protein HRT68_10925 [Flavobacteriaceae bacterium]|nr:hypothetical protein [Flavobacteriaceae bacterium]
MQTKTILVVYLITVLLLGCSKSDDSNTSPIQEMKIRVENIGPDTINLFKIHANDQVISFNQFANNEISEYYVIPENHTNSPLMVSFEIASVTVMLEVFLEEIGLYTLKVYATPDLSTVGVNVFED